MLATQQNVYQTLFVKSVVEMILYNTIQTLLYNQRMYNQLLSKLASKSNC